MQLCVLHTLPNTLLTCSNSLSDVDDVETATVVTNKGEVHVADQSEGAVDSTVDTAVTNDQTDVFAISSSYGIIHTIKSNLSMTSVSCMKFSINIFMVGGIISNTICQCMTIGWIVVVFLLFNRNKTTSIFPGYNRCTHCVWSTKKSCTCC